MKLSKILMASTVLAAAVGFMSCTDEDDPFNLITEENSNLYTIDATNDEASIVRGYRSTNFKHAGALIKVSFSKKATGNPNGVMGLIFGLHDGAAGKDFNVIGLRDNGDYYISALKNVKDLQDNNFGAVEKTAADYEKETENPVELVKVKLNTTNNAAKTDADGYSTYIYYKDTVGAQDATTQLYAHTYEVYLLKDATDDYVADDTGKVYTDSTKATEVNLGTAVTTITYADASKDPVQYKFAPYANVYPVKENVPANYGGVTGTGSLKGSWKVQGTYKEAGVEAN